MWYPRRKPRNFGVADRLPCLNCGDHMSLTRRGPDPDDLNCERQTFTCRACHHQIERIVDADGNTSDR